MDEMYEVSLRVHNSVVWTVMGLSETVRADTRCTQVTLAEGSELDDYRQVLSRAATIESCLRAKASLQRTQVDTLVRRVQGAGDLPWDDCVVTVFPLWNVVSMADDGTALVQPDPDNQVVIQYPRRFDLLAMGEDRAEVLQRIATVANIRGMEATEVTDTVLVSARFVTNDQGNMTSDMFRAVNEIVVDLCHVVRSQNQHAVETRRRGLELEARAQAGPVVLAGPPVKLNLNAGHAFLAEWGLQLTNKGDSLADEGDIKDDRSVGSGWGKERPPFGPDPVSLTDNEV